MKIAAVTDTKALGALAAQLSVVASGDTARAIMSEIAADFGERVLHEFDTGRGPYGNAWPKPKAGNPPGRRTGALLAGIRVRPSGNRVLLSASGVSYAGYFSRHAGGIFPDGRLPVAWKASADAIVKRIIAARMRGR